MTFLQNNLAEAWAAKANRLNAELEQAIAYPAFFKPEYVEELREELKNAVAWFRLWSN